MKYLSSINWVLLITEGFKRLNLIFFHSRKWKIFLYIYREYQNNAYILTRMHLDMSGI